MAKRKKCKCHDIKSCTKYVAKAYSTKRRFAAGKARKARLDDYYSDVY
jgi:hypothetical protein